MSRVVLVHGSVLGGGATWSSVVRGLRDRFDVYVVERPGFPPGPPVDRVDFEEHAHLVAAELKPGDHLVGHSYGGVIALLAAAEAGGRVASLTVIEPPCTSVALDDPDVAAFADGGVALWASGPRDDPEAFLRAFLRAVGSAFDPPSPLTPDLEQGARLLVGERGPWEAVIPLTTLAALPCRKLVVSGAHHAAFDGICDVLERALPAERLVLPGFGHAVQRHPDFVERLIAFLDGA
jgi:pimeloyl-ACP methyl ester carboxylesterase